MCITDRTSASLGDVGLSPHSKQTHRPTRSKRTESPQSSSILLGFLRPIAPFGGDVHDPRRVPMTQASSTNLEGKRVAFLTYNDGVEQVELTEPWEALKQTGATPVLISPSAGTT